MSADTPPVARAPWRTNALLFLATTASVLLTATLSDRSASEAMDRSGILAALTSPAALLHGLQFTATLLTILVAHELGHFVAAKIHKVDASLPYFIPLPLLSPFGTMGAVIRMRGTIASRKALLDIGASGPLAGLAFALPLYFYGAKHSHFVVAGNPDGMELGESLVLKLLDRLAVGHVPAGMELELSAVAFAAWGGMFVTMINLLPVGQLDGGHVAYALFGGKQDTFARWAHRATLAFFFVSLASFVARDLAVGREAVLYHLGRSVGNSIFWLAWFEMLAILGSLAQRGNGAVDDKLGPRLRGLGTLGLIVIASIGRTVHHAPFWAAWFVGLALLLVAEVRYGTLSRHHLLDHPPTGAKPLGTGRMVVAIVTLLFFVGLFMPTPIAM